MSRGGAGQKNDNLRGGNSQQSKLLLLFPEYFAYMAFLYIYILAEIIRLTKRNVCLFYGSPRVTL